MVILASLIAYLFIGFVLFKKALKDIISQEISEIDEDPLILFLGCFAMYKSNVTDLFLKGNIFLFALLWPFILFIACFAGVFLKIRRYQHNLVEGYKEEYIKSKEEVLEQDLKESALENLVVEFDEDEDKSEG